MVIQPLKTLGSWYARNERRISSISLVTGFIFDLLFVQQIDIKYQSIWIGAHILIATIVGFLIHWKKTEVFHFWALSILQFLLGGMLGTLLMFYMKGAVFAVAWPFFLVLTAGIIGNEFLKKHYKRVSLQIGFIFFGVFLLMIYLVPMMAGNISQFLFIVSGIMSLIVITGIYYVITFSLQKTERYKVRTHVRIVILSMYILLNGMYFSGAIPPLPLMIPNSGIFHMIQRSPSGVYTAQREPRRTLLFGLIQKRQTLTLTGNLVYAYSAVRSPVSFQIRIVHQWQYYNSSTGTWETRAEIATPVTGGRSGGYRTYSQMRIASEGKWRVNIKTTTGQTIGRIRFIATSSTPITIFETVTLP
jgi:hypothetical protein